MVGFTDFKNCSIEVTQKCLNNLKDVKILENETFFPQNMFVYCKSYYHTMILCLEFNVSMFQSLIQFSISRYSKKLKGTHICLHFKGIYLVQLLLSNLEILNKPKQCFLINALYIRYIFRFCQFQLDTWCFNKKGMKVLFFQGMLIALWTQQHYGHYFIVNLMYVICFYLI